MPINDFKISKEELDGMRLGMVIHNADSDNLRRVKVRVKGVFDEPVKKDHIPYAIPLVNCRIPELGSYVGIMFKNNDINQPYYIPRSFIDKKYIEYILKLYASVISGKESRIKKDVDVFNVKFSEPDVGTTAEFLSTKDVEVIPENKAEETTEGVDTSNVEKAFVYETDKTLGKEQISKTHPTGTFIDIKPDGSIVMHSVKDEFNVVEGNKNELVEGNSLIRVKGKLHIQVDGDTEIKIGAATLVINAAGEIILDAPKMQIKGAELQVDGLATAGANLIKGPFCAINACIYSSAPHLSNKALNN